MVSLCWFVLGFLVGFAAAELIIYVVVNCHDKKLSNEEFVKKLIEKEGWTDARWELETLYCGRYMRIWRKLYRKHIEGGKSNGQD